jgi:hypothetical protein
MKVTVSEDLSSIEKNGFPEMDSEKVIKIISMAVFVYQRIVVKRGRCVIVKGLLFSSFLYSTYIEYQSVCPFIGTG